MNESSKIPYLFAAGAVGAVGYLFFTDSGRQKVDAISQFRIDETAKLPVRIDNARRFLEKQGKNVGGRVSGIVSRVKDSVSAGQQAYQDAGQMYQIEIGKLHHSNDEVIANLHRAVDNLGKLFRTAQEAMIDPFYEVGAIARGVGSGVQQLASGREIRNKATFPRAPHRVMG